jgi:hypothetical protein
MAHVTDTLWNAVLHLLVNAKILVRLIFNPICVYDLALNSIV